MVNVKYLFVHFVCLTIDNFVLFPIYFYHLYFCYGIIYDG